MIYVDASRYNNTPHQTGVENYSVHLIDALVKLASGETCGEQRRTITLVTPKKIPLEVPQLIISFPRLWTQVRLSWEVWRNAALRDGTLFVPSHVMPWIHPKKTVVTIHDVAFKRFPECYGVASRWYLDWSARFAVKNAFKIIVPSQVTKDDLVEFYKCDPGKVVVIPHGYSSLLSSRVIRRGGESRDLDPSTNARGDNEPYFLFLGRIERKKNLLTLIRAFNQFHQTHPNWRLVLAGKPGVGGEEITAAARQNPAIELPGYVDETVKIELLKNASAFVFPSLYEGFGFPLLEAMEFNLPIIASDIPASREVAGDAVLYFSPMNVDELANQMTRMANNPPSINVYNQILGYHSWEQCAKKTFTVLNLAG